MKNAVIVVLVLAVGVMGYVLVVKEDSPDSQKTASTTNADTAAPQPQTTPAKSNGKTIDLSNKGLSQISKDILDDSSATTLNVSGNNLTGALPAEIRKLTNLEVLIASDNKMTGIPAEIGQLSKLKTANFANNNLSGLPQEIGNLRNLETFDLRGNPKLSKNDLSLIQSKLPNAKFLTD